MGLEKIIFFEKKSAVVCLSNSHIALPVCEIEQLLSNFRVNATPYLQENEVHFFRLSLDHKPNKPTVCFRKKLFN